MKRFVILVHNFASSYMQVIMKPSMQCQSLLLQIIKLVSEILLKFTQYQRNICWTETTNRDDVHPVMREFNINKGYRHTGRDWRYYLISAFRMHNETINWLSHAVGAMLIFTLSAFWTLKLRATADLRDIQLVWMFTATSVLLHTLSSLAHLLHSRSEKWHCWVFFADNAAVGLSGYTNNLLSVSFFSSTSYYNFVGPWTIPVLVIGAFCLSASYSWALAAFRRRYNLITSFLMFGPAGFYMLFGFVPILHRQLQMGQSAADYIGILHYSVFTTAVVCYAAYFPERWWPGQFDLIGHSHQLFHCLVTASHCILLCTVFSEIERDGPTLFSKRRGDWISVPAAFQWLIISSLINSVIAILYAKLFWYDQDFKSKASRCRTD